MVVGFDAGLLQELRKSEYPVKDLSMVWEGIDGVQLG